ncbi:hypothetical protein LDENG_00193640 [Lucifuga dentata]|nr:hypothetical protein LDENG_00193640 [Lucifuga dentata]
MFQGVITEEVNKAQILPTLVTFGASSQEQEDEKIISEDNANGNTDKEDGVFEVTNRRPKNTAVLLSEEELVQLMKKDADEEDTEEEEGEQEEEMEEGRSKVESDDAVEDTEDKEAEGEKKKLEDNLEMDKDTKEVTDEEEEEEEEEEAIEETTDNAEMLEKEDEVEVEEMSLKEKEEESVRKMGSREGQEPEMEEIDGSTESEIPVDLDYAADSDISQPLHIISANHHLSTTDIKDKETSKKDFPTIADEHNTQKAKAADSEEESQAKSEGSHDNKKAPRDMDSQEPKAGRELEGSQLTSKEHAEEEEKNKNESTSHSKRKMRKQKKNQRSRKHSPQRNETQAGQEQSQVDPQASEGSNTDNAVKAKKRRAGKWGPIVGMNPVQIRASVDLYPSSRLPVGGGIHHPEVPTDPCDNFHCKRGKICKLDADKKPGCVCQEPSECRHSMNEFDHVCGTDNNTYDTSCELFATKCNLEGTKKGHRLHLDYTGPCKLIPPCLDSELVQFPMRMRDWLKNVLLQLYEHESMTPGFLTAKQRFRVKKIYESERHLHAGDYSVELLAQDFEKNYNMYIYPVHWQFAQVDKHPSDRFLSHSELAPLRVPLVPMEHCTS